MYETEIPSHNWALWPIDQLQPARAWENCSSSVCWDNNNRKLIIGGNRGCATDVDRMHVKYKLWEFCNKGCFCHYPQFLPLSKPTRFKYNINKPLGCLGTWGSPDYFIFCSITAWWDLDNWWWLMDEKILRMVPLSTVYLLHSQMFLLNRCHNNYRIRSVLWSIRQPIH